MTKWHGLLPPSPHTISEMPQKENGRGWIWENPTELRAVAREAENGRCEEKAGRPEGKGDVLLVRLLVLCFPPRVVPELSLRAEDWSCSALWGHISARRGLSERQAQLPALDTLFSVLFPPWWGPWPCDQAGAVSVQTKAQGSPLRDEMAGWSVSPLQDARPACRNPRTAEERPHTQQTELFKKAHSL